MPQHIVVSTAKAARIVTASSAVTIPRPSLALIIFVVTTQTCLRLRSASLEEAGKRMNHHQDEFQQSVLDWSAGHDCQQHPGDGDRGDDADRPFRTDHAALVTATECGEILVAGADYGGF